MDITNLEDSKIQDFFTVLNKLGRILISVQDSSKVLRQIAEHAKEILGADIIDLYEYDQAREHFTLPPILVGERWHPHVPKEKIYPDDVVVKVVKEGKPKYFRDAQGATLLTAKFEVAREDAPDKRFVLREGVVSSVSVPLKAGAETVGIMFVNYRTLQEFTDLQKNLVESFSNLAAIAIYNARLLENLQYQAKRHRTLNEIGDKLSGLLDETKILKEIARSATKTLDCVHCTVFRLQDEELVVAASHGEFVRSMRPGRTFKLGQGVAGWVAQNGVPALVIDTFFDKRFERGWHTNSEGQGEDDQDEPRSLLVVPIFIKENVYGVVSVEKSFTSGFNRFDQEFLEILANQASSAVENTRHVERLLTLNNVSRELSSKLDIQAVFTEAVQAIYKTIKYSHSTFFILENDVLIPKASIAKKGFPKVDRKFGVDEGLVGRVVRTGTSILTGNAKKEEGFSVGKRLPDVDRSMILAPVKTSSGIFGVISVDQDRLDAFTEQDLRTVETLALQIGIAVENANLLEHMKLLQNISVAISETLNIEDTLKLIVKGAVQLTGTESGVIHLIDDKKLEISHSYAYPEDGLYTPSRFSQKKGFTWDVYTTGKTITVPDLTKDKSANKKLIEIGVRGLIGIPLKIENKIIGALFLNDTTKHEFSTQERELLATLTNNAAIAIRNVRLWELRGTQLDSLKEIIDVIGTKEDPLSAILEQTAALFSVNNGSISRLTEDGQYLQHKARWAAGKLENDIKEDPHPINKGITGYVVRTGLSFRTGDVNKVKFYAPWYPTTKSELAIPLKNVFGGIVGVLNLESDFTDFFTDEDEKLGESFANAVSAAIQQSDLIDDMQSLQHLTESHTLKELLDRILWNITKFMGKNTAASINLYDAENDFFYAFDGVGPNQKFVDEYLLIPPRKNGTGRYVLKTKVPLFYDDVNNIPSDLPKVRSEFIPYEIASFAVLPLIYQDDIVGTLFIQKIKDQIKFTDDAKRVLETYATQAALAIHNAQRLIEVQPIKAILGATVSMGLESILKLIVEKAVDIMASDYASIWMQDQDTGDLISRAIYIRTEEQDAFVPGIERITGDQASVNMNVFKKRESIIVNDVKSAEREGYYHRIYKNAKSEIAVPLIFGDEILGTLNTESKYLGAYSEFDKTTLRIFADVAAVAIANSKTYEQRLKDIAALEEINSAIGRKELNEIHMLIAQKAMELTNAAYSTLWLLDDKSRSLKVGAVFGRDALEDALALNDSSINGHVASTRKSYICADTTQDGYYHEWYPDVLSNLTVPIVFDEQLIGTLHVESTQKGAYNENHKKLLESLAYQAAIAIENARLFGERAKKNINLQAVIDMGKDLTASVDLNELQVLHLIHKKLDPLMETENMYIALYDHATDMVRFPLMFIDGQANEVPARKAGSGRTEHIIETKKPIFIATREESIAWYKQTGREEYIGEPFASWIGVPLISGDKAIGVIATYHKTDDYVYDQDDLEVLQAIANQSAIALEVTHRVAELKALQGLTDDLSAGLM